MGNHELKFLHFIEKGLKLPPKLDQLKKEMGKNLNQWLEYIKAGRVLLIKKIV